MRRTFLATLKVNDAAKMTPEQREDVIEWLELQADYLRKDAADYAPRYDAAVVRT